MNFITDIKNRLSIVDILNHLGIKLNSSGFIHSIYKIEKTASLKIYPESNSFYCYATNQGGDQIKFYCDYSKVDIKQGIKELSELLNLDAHSNRNEKLVGEKIKPHNKNKRTIFDFEKDYFEECAAIAEFDNYKNRDESEAYAFEQILLRRKDYQIKVFEGLYNYWIESGFTDKAYEYLTGPKRGLTPATLKQFKLFELHSVADTIQFLKDSFDRNEIIVSGLFSNKYFLFTKHRIIISYLEDERITYLRGRYFYRGSSIPEGIGKYIGCNNRSGTLSPKRFFNIDILKNLKPYQELIITEGEFDAMISQQTGINAIGISGVSNFPKNQIDLIKNYNIYLAFDSDEAGRKAIRDISGLIDKPIKVIKLKIHKDITDLINAETK